ncbi:hypothetical protein [Candidatus Tisiphia endosymbiont of Hybos culiciformis]
MIKNITIVSCHSREGRNLDTCVRKVNTKQDCFVDLRSFLQ